MRFSWGDFKCPGMQILPHTKYSRIPTCGPRHQYFQNLLIETIKIHGCIGEPVTIQHLERDYLPDRQGRPSLFSTVASLSKLKDQQISSLMGHIINTCGCGLLCNNSTLRLQHKSSQRPCTNEGAQGNVGGKLCFADPCLRLHYIIHLPHCTNVMTL